MKKLGYFLVPLALAGCGMGTDYSCDAAGTQDMVKRLYALKLNQARTPPAPRGSPEQLMDQYAQQRDDDLKATLNGIDSQSVDIDGVRVTDIRQISGPAEDEDGPYECAARITAALPQSEAGRARQLADKLVMVGIEVDGTSIDHALGYRSSIEDDGARQAVEITMPPMRQLMLKLLVAPQQSG